VRKAVNSSAFSKPVAVPLASSKVTTPLGAVFFTVVPDLEGGPSPIIFVPIVVAEVKGYNVVSILMDVWGA
jgi:hypothetical protein